VSKHVLFLFLATLFHDGDLRETTMAGARRGPLGAHVARGETRSAQLFKKDAVWHHAAWKELETRGETRSVSVCGETRWYRCAPLHNKARLLPLRGRWQRRRWQAPILRRFLSVGPCFWREVRENDHDFLSQVANLKTKDTYFSMQLWSPARHPWHIPGFSIAYSSASRNSSMLQTIIFNPFRNMKASVRPVSWSVTRAQPSRAARVLIENRS
jgi:hypothetical protein